MIRRCTSPPLSHYRVQISIICPLFFFLSGLSMCCPVKITNVFTCGGKTNGKLAPSRCPKTYITYMFWLHPISFPDTRGTFKMLFYKMLNCYDGLFVADDVMSWFHSYATGMSDMRCSHSYLLQFVRDHGESSEDAVCGAGDGDDPLRTGALWDVDPSAALWGERSSGQLMSNINTTV